VSLLSMTHTSPVPRGSPGLEQCFQELLTLHHFNYSFLEYLCI
jgi:hypothetical protein